MIWFYRRWREFVLLFVDVDLLDETLDLEVFCSPWILREI